MELSDRIKLKESKALLQTREHGRFTLGTHQVHRSYQLHLTVRREKACHNGVRPWELHDEKRRAVSNRRHITRSSVVQGNRKGGASSPHHLRHRHGFCAGACLFVEGGRGADLCVYAVVMVLVIIGSFPTQSRGSGVCSINTSIIRTTSRY